MACSRSWFTIISIALRPISAFRLTSKGNTRSPGHSLRCRPLSPDISLFNQGRDSVRAQSSWGDSRDRKATHHHLFLFCLLEPASHPGSCLHEDGLPDFYRGHWLHMDATWPSSWPRRGTAPPEHWHPNNGFAIGAGWSHLIDRFTYTDRVMPPSTLRFWPVM